MGKINSIFSLVALGRFVKRRDGDCVGRKMLETQQPWKKTKKKKEELFECGEGEYDRGCTERGQHNKQGSMVE